MDQTLTKNVPSDLDILADALEVPDEPSLLEGARFISKLDLREAQKRRATTLLQGRGRGSNTEAEEAELAALMRANTLLSLLKAKAKLALKRAGQEV